VYKASNSEEATLTALDDLEAAWEAKYPLGIQTWRHNWGEIVTSFKYPPEIYKLIFTTNMIESYHRQLWKIAKSKSVFSTNEALLKMQYFVTQDVLSNGPAEPTTGVKSVCNSAFSLR
jgi:transposase-like protein